QAPGERVHLCRYGRVVVGGGALQQRTELLFKQQREGDRGSGVTTGVPEGELVVGDLLSCGQRELPQLSDLRANRVPARPGTHRLLPPAPSRRSTRLPGVQTRSSAPSSGGGNAVAPPERPESTHEAALQAHRSGSGSDAKRANVVSCPTG